MKTIKQILQSRAGIFGMICLLAATFSSCRKDGYYNNGYNNGSNTSNTPYALISMVNASTDSQPLDVYLDQNHANSSPFSYGRVLDYLAAYTGKRIVSFYNSGSSTKVAADSIVLSANNYYSLFLSGSIAKPSFILLTDTLTLPATGMAKVRFINLSTDAGTVDVGFKGTTAFVTNKAYKGFSSFASTQANTYTIEIRKTGTSTVLASLSNVTLQSGSIYTMWLHGSVAATDQTKLNLDVQRNAYQ